MCHKFSKVWAKSHWTTQEKKSLWYVWLKGGLQKHVKDTAEFHATVRHQKFFVKLYKKQFFNSLEKSSKCYRSPSKVFKMHHKSAWRPSCGHRKTTVAVRVMSILTEWLASSPLASDGCLPVSVFVLQEKQTTSHIVKNSTNKWEQEKTAGIHSLVLSRETLERACLTISFNLTTASACFTFSQQVHKTMNFEANPWKSGHEVTLQKNAMHVVETDTVLPQSLARPNCVVLYIPCF